MRSIEYNFGKPLPTAKSSHSRNIRFLLVIVLIVVFTEAYSQNVVILEKNSIHNIGKKTSYFEDEKSNFSIKEILSDSISAKFKPYYKDAPNFSSTASAYWLKFKIRKESQEDFFLEIGTAFMDSITLYEFDEVGNLNSVRFSGDNLPYNSREVEVGSFLFEVDIPVHSTYTYYLRIKSTQPLFFPLRVGSLKSFVAYNHDLDYIQGIYFGFMLLIFFYNLFLYLKTRESIYLYYVAYVLSITWFMASIFGYFFEYLWPNSPAINQNVVVSSGLTLITATLFTQKFLDIKKFSKKLYYGTQLFLFTGIAVCLLVLFGNKIVGLQTAQGGLLLMAFFYLVLGAFFKLKGRKEATYYLLAWGALLIGIIFALLESLNLIPVMPYLNAMQIGSGLEALLLSFALGEKISTYKKQKEEAMALALASAKEKERLIQDQNITLEREVRKRTEQIAEQNEELQSINEEKNQLIGIVAHDLRSPLNQIKGVIQLLRMDSANFTKENTEMLDLMQQSAERQTQMISRILDVNAVESKTINLHLEQVDILQVTSTVLNHFEYSAKEKSINLQFITKGDGDFYAIVDENYLIQVLENLISNAIKFSPHKSEVRVHINKPMPYIEIKVADEGPGISNEDKKNLFKPYRKLSATPTGGESSIGLGLSIAKKYIEAMNGQISCESKEGKGTKFSVRFRAVED